MPDPKPAAGRAPDRRALCGILFVLDTGIQREHPPQEPGFGSGMTCRRRLAAWDEAGVWDRRDAQPMNAPPPTQGRTRGKTTPCATAGDARPGVEARWTHRGSGR
ncbi:transposase [Streptomyces altiplanensis]